MSRILTTILAVSAAVACSAAARPDAASAPVSVAAAQFAPAPSIDSSASMQAETISAEASMRCDVRVTPTSNGVRLEAFAHAARPMAGEYSLVVTKNGAAGSSDISQSDVFDLADGGSTSLSMVDLGLERGASFRAVLTVTDANGRSCRDVVRS